MQPLLIAAFCAALAYQVFFAGSPDGGHSAAGSTIKTLSTASLAIHGAMVDAPWLIVVGLALGALGDLALSRPGKTAFLAGMAAFAAGHLAYVWAFWGWIGPDISIWQWVGLGLLFVLTLSTEIWLAPHTSDLRWPVRVYGGIIAAMAAMALLLAPVSGSSTIQLGAAFFVLSDVLLALRLFVVQHPGRQRILSLLLWPAYWGGQALILIGVVLHG